MLRAFYRKTTQGDDEYELCLDTSGNAAGMRVIPITLQQMMNLTADGADLMRQMYVTVAQNTMMGQASWPVEEVPEEEPEDEPEDTKTDPADEPVAEKKED